LEILHPAISRWRRLVVHTILAVVVGGHALAVIRGQELWPFSYYPMYSRIIDDDVVTSVQLFGVYEDRGAPREFVLESSHTYPLGARTTNGAADRLLRRREHQLVQALRDLLERYERRRQAQKHQGPPLQGLRLYQLRWRLDIETATPHLLDRALLYEMRVPEAKWEGQ
jgi:hypothetical protein